MASIRNRSPWRVSAKGASEHDAAFPSKKQAEAHAQVLRAQGLGDVGVVQDRSGAWEARVRRLGGRDLVKTFDTKKLASDWAAAREGEIVKGQFIDTTAADRCTVGELFKRFADECTKSGPSGDPERYRLKAFQKLDWAALKVSALQSCHIAAFRDAELKRGLKPASVIKHMELISRVLNTAHKDWGVKLPINPASAREVRRPKLGADAARNRTLLAIHMMSSAEEVERRVAKVSGKTRLKRCEERQASWHRQGVYLDFHPDVASLLKRPVTEHCAIMRAARYSHWFKALPVGKDHAPLIIPGRKARHRGSECRIWAIESFGIETAMRRGEMAQLEWSHVHLEEGYLELPAHITKGQHSRIVPLTLRALRILRSQPRSGELVFNATVEAIERAHELVMARCGARNLRFHDFRHEATTRLVQGTTMSPLMVGQITGHRDMRSLARYYNPKPQEIVQAFNTLKR